MNKSDPMKAKYNLNTQGLPISSNKDYFKNFYLRKLSCLHYPDFCIAKLHSEYINPDDWRFYCITK